MKGWQVKGWNGPPQNKLADFPTSEYISLNYPDESYHWKCLAVAVHLRYSYNRKKRGRNDMVTELHGRKWEWKKYEGNKKTSRSVITSPIPSWHTPSDVRPNPSFGALASNIWPVDICCTVDLSWHVALLDPSCSQRLLTLRYFCYPFPKALHWNRHHNGSNCTSSSLWPSDQIYLLFWSPKRWRFLGLFWEIGASRSCLYNMD